MTRIPLFLAALLVLQPAQALTLPSTSTSPGSRGDGLEKPERAAPAALHLRPRSATGFELARGGGRGGGGRGGDRGGGRIQRGNTGMDRAPRSFDRGNRKPSGGWSRDTVDRADRVRPSLDRTSFDRTSFDRKAVDRKGFDRSTLDRDTFGTRGDGSRRQALQDRMATGNRETARERMANVNRDDWNRRRDQLRENHVNDWDRARDRIENGWNDRRSSLNQARDNWNDRWNDRRDRINDNLNDVGRRVDRAYDRYNNYWPGWVRPGWNVARPWNWGWYGGWSTPPWGWWGVRSAAWGLGTLATAAVINNAVNNAIAASQTTIVVPDTTYQLYFNSVETSGEQGVSFVVNDGVESRQITADCRDGTLNGQEPSSATEAQLLNAACQVAFGA